MKNLHQFEFLEAFQCHVHHFQCLTVPVAVPLGMLSIENGVHGTEKQILEN